MGIFDGLKKGVKAAADSALADIKQGFNDANASNSEKFALDAFTRGKDAYKRGQYDLAIKEFNSIIEKYNAGHDGAYAYRGDCYRIKEQHDLAISDANEAIRLNPNSSMAYGTRGESSRAKGNRAQAISDLEKAISLNPPNEWAQERLDKARAMPDPNYKPAEVDPNLPGSRQVAAAQKCKLIIESGGYDEVIKFTTEALGLVEPSKPGPSANMTEASLLTYRGAAYRAKGQHDLAIADLTKSLTLSNNNPSAYAQRGAAYAAKGQRDLAIADLEEARSYSSHDAEFVNSEMAKLSEAAAPPPPVPSSAAFAAGCQSCGAQVADGAKFCNGCGAQIQAKPQARFCSQCGAKSEGGKFCNQCGAQMPQ